jgi:hypothetical protein
MLRIQRCLDNRITAVRLYALSADRALFHTNIFFLCHYFILGLSNFHGLVRPEVLGRFKNTIASQSLEPVTFRLVA